MDAHEWAEKNKHTLDESTLYRCIHRRFLVPDELRRSMTDRLIRYGIRDIGAARIVDTTKRYLLNLTNEQLISFHVNYRFRPSPASGTGTSRYAAGRFNDGSFPALYAAEDEHTCIEEAWHNVRGVGCQTFNYAVFSIHVTMLAADLRPAIIEKRWEFPDEHGPCQVVGKYVYSKGFGGLLAYSKRNDTGTCCVMYDQKSIRPGNIVDLAVKAMQ